MTNIAMNCSLWTPLHAKVHQTLLTRHLLPAKQRLLVAVSGGQDSLCLAKLLLDLQSKWGWDLAIAHCDHRWRSDSQANAAHVEQLAQSWQLPFYLQTATDSIQNEGAARQWRYEALSAIAREGDYPYIVTGHTLSDRAETLLYNLIRGAGADGLQALSWKRLLIETGGREKGSRGAGEQGSRGAGEQREKGENYPLPITNYPLPITHYPIPNPQSPLYLVRPLLEVRRSQTAEFCHEAGLSVWEDSTNSDRHYARNRIRQELLPYLQTHFNPQVEQHLAQTAELLRADVEYLEATASQFLLEALSHTSTEKVNHESTNIRVNRLILRTQPLAIQRRAMRQLLQKSLNFSPNFEHIEKLISLISAPNRSQTDPFPGGAIAIVDGEWIWIKKSQKNE